MALGEDLGKRLCEILSIETKGVTSITLECKPGEAALVRLTKLVDVQQAMAIEDEFQKYTLGEEVKTYQFNERDSEV